MIKIGITGLIGSGKSTVCKIFENLNISTYNADTHAKQLMVSNNQIKKQLINLLGKEVYNIDNSINKTFLSDKIFNSESIRLQVNSIVHPVVIEDFKEWTTHQKSEIAVIESAILYEAKIKNIVDYIVEVVAPLSILEQRIMERDKTNNKIASKKIKIQKSVKEKEKKTNFVIVNNEKKSLLEQILKIITDIYQKEEIIKI